MVNFQLRTIIWGSVSSTVLIILPCCLFLQVLKGTEISMVNFQLRTIIWGSVSSTVLIIL